MALTYKTRQRAQNVSPERASAPAGPDIHALAAGAAPTNEQMGSRVDLPGEIREKMENSFGADFSNVRLYESETVADAGAEAVTQGTNIAFAPGKLDLTSTAGQALLGHELSHVVSQSRGESAGQGFLNDAGLEAQADRQGMMATQGESVYQGPVSPVGMSSTMSAAGPMQAKKKSKLERETEANNIGSPQFLGHDRSLVSDLRAGRKNIKDTLITATDEEAAERNDSTFLLGRSARDEHGRLGKAHDLDFRYFQEYQGHGNSFPDLVRGIQYQKPEGGDFDDMLTAYERSMWKHGS